MQVKTTTQNLDIPMEEVMPKRMYSIRDRLIIVQFEATRFSNSQSDPEAKYDLHNSTGAAMDTFNVSKQKIAKKIVSRVSKFYSRGRDLVRVPKSRSDGSVKYQPMKFGIAQWDKGSVLVPVDRYVDMETAFHDIQNGMKKELEAMRGEWDEMIRKTKHDMQGMYDPSVIPTFDEFAASWGMKLSVCALPDMDPRITLDELQFKDVANQIKQATCDRVVADLSKGWSNAAESLLTSLEYVAAVFANDREAVNKLNDPEGKQPKARTERAVCISETLFENLSNQLATAQALADITEDKNLQALCKKVEETLGNTQARYLTSNPAERRRYATAAKSLVSEAKRTVESTREEINNAVDELSAFA